MIVMIEPYNQNIYLFDYVMIVMTMSFTLLNTKVIIRRKDNAQDCNYYCVVLTTIINGITTVENNILSSQSADHV